MDLPGHDHEFYEVTFIFGGSGVHLTEDGAKPLSPGDLIVTSPGQLHAFRDNRGLALYNVYYLAEWLSSDISILESAPHLAVVFLGGSLFPQRTPTAPHHVSLQEDCREIIGAELAQLAANSYHDDRHPILLRGSLLKCLALCDIGFGPDSAVEHHFLSHPLVQRVYFNTEACLAAGNPCDVEAWAKEIHYSRDHFTRVFREHTGETPYSYYQRRRLQRAAYALVHTSDHLSDIATRLGFSDSAHFTRTFHKKYGLSPMRYRQRFWNQADKS